MTQLTEADQEKTSYSPKDEKKGVRFLAYATLTFLGKYQEI